MSNKDWYRLVKTCDGKRVLSINCWRHDEGTDDDGVTILIGTYKDVSDETIDKLVNHVEELFKGPKYKIIK